MRVREGGWGSRAAEGLFITDDNFLEFVPGMHRFSNISFTQKMVSSGPIFHGFLLL